MIARLPRAPRALAAACSLALLGASAHAADPPLNASTARPLVETLENGLRIVVLEHRTAPLVTVQGWVNSGSTTEGDALGSGLSHYLEHMLFKGTARRSVGAMGREVKALGGQTNAYTSFDRTVYYINCPPDGTMQALDILTDVLNNATMDPEELDRERGVVLKEVNRTLDNPAAWAGRMLFETAFLHHPYRYPVIGYKAQLRVVTREQIVAYYKRFYAPNNIALIIVGDVDGPAVMAEAKRLWQDIPRRGVAEPVRSPEPLQLAPREYIEERDAQLAHVAIGFHGPALADPDLYPMDVLSLILGGGRTSRLYRRVREEAGLVHSISAFSYTPRDPGLFGVSLSTDPDKREAAVAATLAEVQRVMDDGVDGREVEIAKRKVVADYYFGRETAGSLASSLGVGLLLAGDLDFDARYVAGVQGTTPAEVQRVARKYLHARNRTVSAVVPTGTLAPATRDVKSATVSPPEVHTLDNGVRVIVRENRTSPVLSLRAVVLGGMRSETAAQAGITNLMSTLLPKGTARWNAAELAEVVESRGGSFGPFSGYNSWGVKVNMLADDWAVACDVLDEVLLRPTFPADALERERTTVLAGIRAQDEDPYTIARRTIRRELYGDHPYRWLTDGSADVVAALTADDLRTHHRRLLDPARIVISASGDVDRHTLLARLNSSIGALGAPGSTWPDPAPPSFSRHAGRVVHDERPITQTMLLISFPGVTVDDPRTATLAVMGAALNGQGGRLFQKLRDEQGLAYSVWFGSTPGLDRGMVTFSIATVTEQRDEALAGLWREIDALRTAGLTAAEIADARRVLENQQVRGLETNKAFAFTVGLDELYGLGARYYEGFSARLAAVTPQRTQAEAAVLFDPAYALVVEVGPDSSHD